MRTYSNPKYSEEYRKEVEWQNYQLQLKREDKEIGQFLKRAVLAVIVFSLIVLTWSVVGN